MSRLQALGLVYYNGVTFGPETETLSVRIVPQLDSARRAVIGNLYSFVIKTKIIATANSIAAQQALGLMPTNDTLLEQVRRLLTVNGGAFVYSAKGLGNIQVNVSGPAGNQFGLVPEAKLDLAWGPIVREISWKPIAGGLASEMVLSIDFLTLDCANASYAFKLMEFCFSVKYEQGFDRLTRRTYKGHIRIPETYIAAGDNRLTDTVDMFGYYEKIAIPCPDGWRPDHEERNIDEAKTRIDFTFIHSMLKAPMPEGLIDYHWTHTQTNSKDVVMSVKNGRISVTGEVALDWPPEVGQIHFDNLWQEKLQFLQNNGNTIIPMRYSATEIGRDRKFEFSITYTLIRQKAAGLQDILGPQGFWRDIPLEAKPGGADGSRDWSLWTASMAIAFKARGYSQDVFYPSQDAIIALCLDPQTKIPEDDFTADDTSGDFLYFFDLKCPEPQDSWLWWECSLEYGTDDGVVVHKPLPSYSPGAPQPPSLGQEVATQVFDGTQGSPPVDPRTPNTFGSSPSVIPQQRTSPTVYIWLTGWAMRMCYDIPEPLLLSVGGSPAIANNRPDMEFYETRLLGNLGPPIKIARWRRRYVLTQQPTQPMGNLSGPLFKDEESGPLEISSDSA